MQKQPVVLPPNRAWTQPNTGNIFGSLFSTRNISLDIPGILSLSKRMQYVYREATSGSNFDHVLAIVYGQFGATTAGFSSTDQYIIVTSDELYMLSGDIDNCGLINNASTPGTSGNSDGVSWEGDFWVTTSTNLAELDSGTWTTGIMSLGSGDPHPLCVSTINNFLLVGDGNELKQRTTAGVNSTAITIPLNYQITWIRSDNSRVLIGTRTLDGTNAAVFEWDESASAATNKYEVDAPWVYSGCFRNTDFFVVTSDGRLMKYNGGGFSTVAQWPIYKTLPGTWDLGTSPTTIGVSQRGTAVIGGRLTINVNGDVSNGYEDSPLYENFASGIWEFDESSGLNHKYGFSVSQTQEDFAQMTYEVGAGAIAPVAIDPNPDPSDGSILLAGARVSLDGTTEYYTLSTVVDVGENRGQFETTRIETNDIADNNLKLWCKYRNVFEATDKILFKYKDRAINHFPFTTNGEVVWTGSTTFTTTDTLFQYVLEGYEVTVASGQGAGAAAHVSSISENAGTYTVVLDEAIPSVVNTDEARVIVDNYVKLTTTITSADDQGYKEIPIELQTDPRTWIQIKVEIRGSYYITIEELQLISSTHVLPKA